MDLKALERFQNSEDTFKLTKLASKRKNSMVDVGQFETGDFALVDIPSSSEGPEGTAVAVYGNGFNWLRTSPVVKIIDQNDTSTTFETEGGVYRLEKI